jgi:hypothetical protein
VDSSVILDVITDYQTWAPASGVALLLREMRDLFPGATLHLERLGPLLKSITAVGVNPSR